MTETEKLEESLRVLLGIRNIEDVNKTDGNLVELKEYEQRNTNKGVKF